MLKINWHLRVLRCRPAEGDGGSSGGGVGPRLIHGQHMFSRCQEYVVLTFRLPVEGVVGTAGRCRYIVSICSGQIWDRLTSRWNREPQRPRKTASFRLSLISICSTHSQHKLTQFLRIRQRTDRSFHLQDHDCRASARLRLNICTTYAYPGSRLNCALRQPLVRTKRLSALQSISLAHAQHMGAQPTEHLRPSRGRRCWRGWRD